jgi:hypothetical protein
VNVSAPIARANLRVDMKVPRLNPREKRILMLCAAVVAVALASVWWLRHRSPALASAARGGAEPAPEVVPRIDLDRLPRERPQFAAGKRDIFAFGPPPTPPPTPRPAGPPPTLVDPATVATPPPVARLPPLNLKYIGSVENGQGLRVAVLLTERNELLTGQAGEVVANRYKIAKIGLESVDLEDVGTGQTKRIALKN